MGGVRKDGILQVDDIGATGGTTPVSISSPIGPTAKVGSLSVTLATDEDAIDTAIPGLTDTHNTTNDNLTGLRVGGIDPVGGNFFLLPIMPSNWGRPDANNQAVSVVMRNGLESDGNSRILNDFISVGGITNKSGIPTAKKLIFGDGNTISADPTDTHGLQVRELGQSFAKNGNISAVNQRFTNSNRYINYTAAIFKLIDNVFIGTIKPVVSLDNGVTWAFVSAINTETGVKVTSLTDAAVAGSFVIPFAAGSTDYGWEITARTSGTVSIYISANSGVSCIFAAGPLTDTELRAAPVLISGSVQAVSDDGLVSGTLSGAGQTVTLDVARYSGVSFQIIGSFSANLEFEASIDGINFVAVNAASPTPGTGRVGQTTTFSTAGVWSLAVSGFSKFRVRISAYGSGSAVVTIRGSVSGAATLNINQSTNDPLNIRASGFVASGAFKSGNPVQTGGVFNTTQPTVTTGQIVEDQRTARGAAIVATGIEGFIVSTKTDLTPSTPTVSSVGIVSAQAVAAAATRKGLILRNLSQARISLGFGSLAVLDSGVTLYPRDIFRMDEYDFDLAAINAIASAAASNLAIQEYLT